MIEAVPNAQEHCAGHWLENAGFRVFLVMFFSLICFWGFSSDFESGFVYIYIYII